MYNTRGHSQDSAGPQEHMLADRCARWQSNAAYTHDLEDTDHDFTIDTAQYLRKQQQESMVAQGSPQQAAPLIHRLFR